MLRPPGFVAHAPTLFQIAASAEDLVARTGQHDAADVVISDGKALEHLHELLAHPGVHGIGGSRTVQGHDEDVIAMPRAGNSIKDSRGLACGTCRVLRHCVLRASGPWQ
jgi:hypothetical protein